MGKATCHSTDRLFYCTALYQPLSFLDISFLMFLRGRTAVVVVPPLAFIQEPIEARFEDSPGESVQFSLKAQVLLQEIPICGALLDIYQEPIEAHFENSPGESIQFSLKVRVLRQEIPVRCILHPMSLWRNQKRDIPTLISHESWMVLRTLVLMHLVGQTSGQPLGFFLDMHHNGCQGTHLVSLSVFRLVS